MATNRLMLDAAVPAPSLAPPPLYFPRAGQAIAPRQLKREAMLPNLPVVSHTGRQLRFYEDVVQDRRVLLHVMYSACALYCPPSTRNLVQARQLLGTEGKRLHFVSITLTPVSDDPKALNDYRQLHGLGDDWLLLTGQPRHLEPLTRALGFLPPEDSALPMTYHATKALVGDEPAVKWGHLSTLQTPAAVARMIRFALA